MSIKTFVRVRFTNGTTVTYGQYKMVERQKRTPKQSAFVRLNTVKPRQVIRPEWPDGPWLTVLSLESYTEKSIP